MGAKIYRSPLRPDPSIGHIEANAIRFPDLVIGYGCGVDASLFGNQVEQVATCFAFHRQSVDVARPAETLGRSVFTVFVFALEPGYPLGFRFPADASSWDFVTFVTLQPITVTA